MASPDKSFVFVDILDNEVLALLSALRAIFNEKTPKTSIHITLRGPYRSDAIWSFMERMDDDNATDPIYFHDFGKFENVDQSVVYLRAHSKLFDRFLYKPDFPKKIFGSNPHVTLYEGTNKSKSNAIFNFLRKEKLYFMCTRYRLTPFFSTKQMSLNFSNEISVTQALFANLIQHGKVESGILERAKKLVATYEANTIGSDQI